MARRNKLPKAHIARLLGQRPILPEERNAQFQLKNTPYSILDVNDPHHPAQKLLALIDRAKRDALAVEDPLAYIREHWDKTIPGCWEVLFEAALASGDIGQSADILAKMTAMSGIAPRSRLEVSPGPVPDFSHLSDEEILRLRGVGAAKDDPEEDEKGER